MSFIWIVVADVSSIINDGAAPSPRGFHLFIDVIVGGGLMLLLLLSIGARGFVQVISAIAGLFFGVFGAAIVVAGKNVDRGLEFLAIAAVCGVVVWACARPSIGGETQPRSELDEDAALHGSQVPATKRATPPAPSPGPSSRQAVRGDAPPESPFIRFERIGLAGDNEVLTMSSQLPRLPEIPGLALVSGVRGSRFVLVHGTDLRAAVTQFMGWANRTNDMHWVRYFESGFRDPAVRWFATWPSESDLTSEAAVQSERSRLLGLGYDHVRTWGTHMADT